MGRQSGDPTVVSSSIALLQERFRELERVRERREEKELLKVFSEAQRITPATSFEPANLSLQPQMIPPPRPPLQDLLSVRPHSQGRRADSQAIKIPHSASLWSTDATIVSTSYNLDNSDVDTSLHL